MQEQVVGETEDRIERAERRRADRQKFADRNASRNSYPDSSFGSTLAVPGVRRNRVRILRPLQDKPSQRASLAQLRAAIRTDEPEQTIRCVVVEPHWPVHEPEEAAELTPWRRLWALLRPEWPDIWNVLLFALVIGLLVLATPLAVEALVNTVAFGRLVQPVVILSLILLGFLSFSAALRGLPTYVVEIIQRRLFARIVGDIAYRLPRVRVEVWDGTSPRELVNRFFEIVTVQLPGIGDDIAVGVAGIAGRGIDAGPGADAGIDIAARTIVSARGQQERNNERNNGNRAYANHAR